MNRFFVILAMSLCLFMNSAYSQNLVQTVRGIIVDKQSQFPIIGASVVLKGSNPLKGTVTDVDGKFCLEDVAVGRISLQVNSMGYKGLIMPNLTVNSAKELFVSFALEETINSLNEVVVKPEFNNREPLNKIATVSARSIGVKDITRYAGSFQDPARMVQSYAGVSGSSDDRNDIIIRGNSPLGVLWKMEGLNIPSPNHFSALGTTGGGMSMLNANTLSNSDFFTGAWSADYGNATAGVFDLQMRNGNNNKREYTGQIGLSGFEFGIEGPFKKGGDASYLLNYRYSALGALDDVGLEFGSGFAIPKYQDLNFKLNFPSSKIGTISFWGIAGKSEIDMKASKEDSDNLYSGGDEDVLFGSDTWMFGATHKYFFNEKTFYRLSLGLSNTKNTGEMYDINFDDNTRSKQAKFERKQTKLSADLKINKKFNAKNMLTAGVVFDHFMADIFDKEYEYFSEDFRLVSDNSGEASLFQSYVNWQHKFSDKLVLNAGVHGQYFSMSESSSIEPRLGLKYNLNSTHTFSLGAGMHSQLQPIPVYFVENIKDNGQVELPSKKLDFTDALHAVVSHNWNISNNLQLKTELYYQKLYNAPIEKKLSSFSMLNEGAGFDLITTSGFENKGKGYNYGIDVTLEKTFSKGYYFLFTSSLFDSKYKGSDGVKRNTAFNSRYIVNALGGKEFTFKNGNTFGIDLKAVYSGGKRYTPINLAESKLQGEEVLFESQTYGKQYDPFFKVDLKFSYKINRPKVSHLFEIDIQNLTNEDNIFSEEYSNRKQKVTTTLQRGMFPMILYRIYF